MGEEEEEGGVVGGRGVMLCVVFMRRCREWHESCGVFGGELYIHSVDTW